MYPLNYNPAFIENEKYPVDISMIHSPYFIEAISDKYDEFRTNSISDL